MREYGKWGTPTIYNGQRFRSQLEADWAHFFDQHDMTWEYEIGHFDLDGVRYLPDFWFPTLRTIIEVKGTADEDDIQKLTAFSRHAGQIGVTTLVVGASVGHHICAVATSPAYAFRAGDGDSIASSTEELFRMMRERPYKHATKGEKGYPQYYTGLYDGVWFVQCDMCDTWYFFDAELPLNLGCPVCHKNEFPLRHGSPGACKRCGIFDNFPALRARGDDPLEVYWQYLNYPEYVPMDDTTLYRWRQMIDDYEIAYAMETACRRASDPIGRMKYLGGIMRGIRDTGPTYLDCQFDFDWPDLGL